MTVSNAAPIAPAGWRVEVTRRGKYWTWRRGSAGNRQCRYGGKFETLPTERQMAYARNRRTHSRTKRKRKAAQAVTAQTQRVTYHGRGRATDIAERVALLPASEDVFDVER